MQKTQKINKVRAFHGAIEVLEKAEQRKKASIKAWLSFLQMQMQKDRTKYNASALQTLRNALRRHYMYLDRMNGH